MIKKSLLILLVTVSVTQLQAMQTEKPVRWHPQVSESGKYLSIQNLPNGPMRIFDMSDPDNPILIATKKGPKVRPVYLQSDEDEKENND